jgi:lipopolysaccharide transport system permease protein
MIKLFNMVLGEYSKYASLASLVLTMVKRDVVGRYKGSFLGVLWSLFNPLLMLCVYTFAFGFIFKSRWSGYGNDPFSFALALFPALLVFNYVSDCVNRAPTLITGNPAYVKKVVFPLAALPVSICLSGLFHFFVGILVWMLAFFVIEGWPHLTIFWLVPIVMPMLAFAFGVSCFLASLGVYFRDVQQITGVVTSALIFLSPVFYAMESIPERFRGLVALNPLTGFIEMSRSVMLYGQHPAWGVLLISFVVSAVVMFLGFSWFRFSRKGFADVL